MGRDVPALALKRRTPQRTIQQLLTVPAPVMGLNTVSSCADMPPTDAVELDNLITTDLGLTVRGGWFEYATHIGGDASHPVGTVMSWEASPTSSLVSPLASSVLFAATDHGIYNIEGGGDLAALTPAIALSGATGAGTLSCVQFTAGGGTQYLIACSESDGTYRYDGLTWKKLTPADITGVDPADHVQVCAWKKRLLFVKQSSTEMWALAPESIGGAAEVFDFGPQLARGGAVLAVASWTQDAGAGIDDRLVVLSSSGDLVVYEGTDPTDATKFSCVGTWYVGTPPVGRRCFTTDGGNVYLLTQFGVIPVSQIVQGGLDSILTSNTQLMVQLRKLQGALNDDFQTMLGRPGWELCAFPSLALLHIARPRVAGNEYIQYAFQMHATAWSRLLDVPAHTFGRRLSEIYAGTEDGRVLRVFIGETDGRLIDGTGSHEIRARCTPAFNYLGAPTQRKQALMLRLRFLADSSPDYIVAMNSDFEVLPIFRSPSTGRNVGSLWDQSFWDHARWSGGRRSFGEWRTVQRMGYNFAPSIYVASTVKTTLASLEYMVKPGGPL